ncbi:glycosyltransferase family 2 protein [Paratractidigestivibacter sp.]|uniref:glycosyltransferase family 2 protein n=2 Tax=Paratractidigestivibacter sp. TaxID=2847316 RepID=UPI002ABE5E17|nr:glycosyltransferase family 2 protein [Paratractidigestivibacter sp.]
MINFKIANILLSEDPQFLGSPHMLCRSTKPFVHIQDGNWCLKGAGKHDFTTFFNALSIKKWRKYSFAEKFGLHFEVRGSACSVYQTRAGAFSYYSDAVEGTVRKIEASADWQTVDFEIVEGPSDVIVAFAIECEGDVQFRGGYYYAMVEREQVREVELALCTTTFKKEDFITRNIGLVKDQILGSDDAIAGHFHMHVVDNGRTLDVEALDSDGVSVHPNDNAGGAGGFARGMIEAMESNPKATHALLMDDDVLISPESIIRTFNLLSLVNDEYKDAFISGAMMNMDEPYVRWEEMGYIGREGAFHPIKPVARMDVLHDVVANETFDIPTYISDCVDQEQHYAAWWYCVIPMTQIEKHGLPVPVFVRGDDVEYSRRCKPKFITMNSICIWHLSFHMRYNAAQERYQMTRNCLIDQFASNFAPMSDFAAQIRGAFNLELSKFNYANAELVLQGIEDFLKGPEWIMQPVAQKAFMDANKNAEKLRPIDELRGELVELGVDVDGLTDWKIFRDRPLDGRSGKKYAITRNGNRSFGKVTEDGKVVVIDNVGWAEPIGKLYGAEYIVAVDITNGKAVIRHKDAAKFQELEKRYQADKADYRKRYDELKRAYSEALPKMTSVAFWKKYLGLSD